MLKKPLMEEGRDLVINSSFLSSNNNNNNSSSIRARIHEPSSSSRLEENKKKKIKKKKEEVQKYCPRCNSTNTKFCYYNNYSLTQPRYFCKTCRRYWTEGGSLRNVPVGGGSRKNKKHSSSSSNYPDTNINPSSSSSSTKMILQQPPQNSNYYQQPFDHQVQDLNLSFLNNNNNDSGGPILGIPMTMPAVLPDHDMFPFGEMKQDQQLMFWNNGMMGGDGSW